MAGRNQYIEIKKATKKNERSQNVTEEKAITEYYDDLDFNYHYRGTHLEDLEVISSRHPDAELIKVFMHSSEKEALKDAVAKKGTGMSHLARILLLQWLKNQEETEAS